MSVPLRTAMLCLAVAAAARCDAYGVLLPKQTSSTSIRLTAQRNDTGLWTTQFGEYQMIIEHQHFDTTKDEKYNDDSTWTIKVKHTSTVYQDEKNTHEADSEAFGQLESTISKLTDNYTLMRDTVDKPIKDAASTDDRPFIAGIQVDAGPTLLSKDTYEQTELLNDNDDDPLYKATEGRQNKTPDDTKNNTNEQEKLTNAGEETKIADRYPRSRSHVQDIMQKENYHKGYRFYYGVGWLKLNTSDWQWPEARDACEEDGGHLAIPDTTQKIGAMRQILKENVDILKRTVLKNQVFVGLFYPDSSRVLTTVLGQIFHGESDSVWLPDEPNNAPPGEDCITLHLDGKMRDVPCFYTLPFICEID